MKYIALTCMIFCLLSACSKNADVSPVNTVQAFPNKVGDRWQYLVNDTFFLIGNPPLIAQYTMTVTVTDSVLLPGNIKANRWVYNTLGSTDTNYVYQHNDTVSFLANGALAGNSIRQYIVPFKLHNSWEYSFNSVHNVTIDSLASITVGQQQYANAYHIYGHPGRTDEILHVAEWTKEQVGVVTRYVSNMGTNNPYKHLTSWSLMSYHVK
jgi:hypothetical protein